jgi:integrase
VPQRARGVTAALVEKGTKPGRFGDGAGLYLLVRSKEAKFWLFRYRRGGRLREMGLGPAVGRTAVSLSAARVKARELHAVVRDGRDPLAERDAAKAKTDADAAKAEVAGITFSDVCGLYLAAHEAGWRSPRHRKQWRVSLDQHVMTALGSLPVASIDTGAVIRVLEPLWRTKTETASRLRGRIEAVLDYAKARNWREGENPARWRGHLDQLLPRRSKVRRVEHHRAMPWREVAGFVQRLRCSFSMQSRCLEFLILTAARSSEARGARWSEIDLTSKVWTIPPERMKGGREHRVPLSESAMAVLRPMMQFGTDGFVFPGLNDASTLSPMTLARLVVATGGAGATVHGMRSTFRDWAGEATNYPREVAEAALAHALEDKTEAAYQRGDLLERRRRLMADWAAFCDRPMVASEVIPLRAAAAE